MQDRLPHMGPAAADQRDSASLASDALSEARGQQQPGNAAADDDDARGITWSQLHESILDASGVADTMPYRRSRSNSVTQ